MWGEKLLKELTDKALSCSKAEETQVSISAWASGLTRFATSYIHQNVAEQDIDVSVKCINEKCIGTASTNRPDKVEETVVKADKISRLQPPNPDFPGLPESKPIKGVASFIRATQDYTPSQRATACKSLIQKASGFRAFGSFSSDALETCIANSKGVFVYNLSTSTFLNTVIMGDSGSGYAQAASRDIREIGYEGIAQKAVEKAKLSQNPSKIETGKYEVILEELATAELLFFLSYLGFNALRYQEGRSCLCDKLGQKVAGENITIWDDGLDPNGFAFPFDYEGVPKQKVSLIENGIAKGLVYDTATAKKEGRESTGHSIGSPTFGPVPLNLFLKGGDATVKEMIKTTKKGILVTRLHYTNVTEPMTSTITGMTRDGTFLIEDGKLTKPLKNLRFTQSILEALSNVTALSEPTMVASGDRYGEPYLFGVSVPAVKIVDWNFTGVTEH